MLTLGTRKQQKHTTMNKPSTDNTACREQGYMSMAVKASIENIEQGGGPFGAVIVRRGADGKADEVISVAGNSVTNDNDPTAHAEVNAIREAARRLGRFSLDDCEIYCSCEPCPMCLGAIYWARLRHVYYACTRKDAEDAGFSDNMIYEELKQPADKRRLPTEQRGREEAVEAMRRWKAKLDKTEY